MMADVIGAVRVLLGADTAAFESGLKAAEKSLGNFSKNINTSMKTVAKDFAKASIAVAALTVFLKRNAEAAEKIQATSERLGIGAEKFQELAFAAKLAGVEQDEFTKAMEQFNRRMGEVTTGTSKQDLAMGRLGLTMQDLK